MNAKSRRLLFVFIYQTKRNTHFTKSAKSPFRLKPKFLIIIYNNIT